MQTLRWHRQLTLRRCLILLATSLAPAAAAAPAQVSLCVKRVPIVRERVAGAASESIGPSGFLYGDQATTPLAIDKVHRKGDSAQYPSNLVVWRFAADGTFRGPEPIAGFVPKGSDGRFVYLEKQEERPLPPSSVEGAPPPLIETSNRVFAVDEGGRPQPIRAPQGRTMRYVTAPAVPGFGPILYTAKADPEVPGRELQERWVAWGSRLSPFEGYKKARWAFPRARLIVLGSNSEITIKDLATRSAVDVATPRMDDFDGIESVQLDRYGWLFVENYGADYAIKLSREYDEIRVHYVTQHTGVGWLGRLVRFLFGMNKGTRVDERHWSPQCVDYSAALRLTFFCKPFRALLDGKLVKVDGVPSGDARWKADATGAGAALVQGPGRMGLYATNGLTGLKLSEGFFGSVQDLPASGRTFVPSRRGYWEVIGKFPNLRLKALTFRTQYDQRAPTKCCLSQFGGGDVRFTSLPGTTDVLAFHSTLGIWRLGRDHVQLLWRASRAAIDLKSIAGARAWKGTVFLTEERTPYVVLPCGPKPQVE